MLFYEKKDGPEGHFHALTVSSHPKQDGPKILKRMTRGYVPFGVDNIETMV